MSVRHFSSDSESGPTVRNIQLNHSFHFISFCFELRTRFFTFNQKISFTCKLKTMHFKLLMMGLSHKIQITIQMNIKCLFFFVYFSKNNFVVIVLQKIKKENSLSMCTYLYAAYIVRHFIWPLRCNDTQRDHPRYYRQI